MKYRTLEVETHHGVGIVWMNRPEVRNAFNDVMIAELTSAFRALEAERDVRAVVLAGRGPAFCAGADLNWMKKMAGNSFAHNYEDALGLARMLHAIDTLSKPTVARVHGAAFAGGMGLIAACDIAVAAQDAEFCVSEVKLGLIPATIGPYVIAAMGERAARRYFLSAERFSAAEAYRIGLVQELVLPQELDEVINGILGDLVQGGPAALAATKDLIHSVAGGHIDESLIADTAKRIATVRASPEGKEGVRAFLEKRNASWVPVPDQPGTRAAKRPAKARRS
ncbi:MAG: enoyl-CoA hydratase/isomerase family protein [Betaproteobacteria bacterium]|nr:enoyl-CoA hydratase/isomerase family protein [Betaproteobacteria bacterium]